MIEAIRSLVRPILTVMGFSALTIGFLSSKIEPGIYVPLVSMMIAFWFSDRKPST